MKVSKGLITVQTDDNERPVPFFPKVRQADIISSDVINNQKLDFPTKAEYYVGNYINNIDYKVDVNGNIDVYGTYNLRTMKLVPTNYSFRATSGAFEAGYNRKANVNYTQRFQHSDGSIDTNSYILPDTMGEYLTNIKKGYFKHTEDVINSNHRYTRSNPTTLASVYSTADGGSLVSGINEYTLLYRPAVTNWSSGESQEKYMNMATSSFETGWWEYCYSSRNGTNYPNRWKYLGKSSSLMSPHMTFGFYAGDIISTEFTYYNPYSLVVPSEVYNMDFSLVTYQSVDPSFSQTAISFHIMAQPRFDLNNGLGFNASTNGTDLVDPDIMGYIKFHFKVQTINH